MLVGTGCPVLPGVTVGVQRGRDVVQELPADGAEMTWVLDARRVGTELRGPYVHGRPGDRFLYLSWQRDGSGMFRRAKLMLAVIGTDLLDRAEEAGLTARFSLAMPDGTPLCAAVRPPRIEWSTYDGGSDPSSTDR
jgi:hypothetical protein